MEPTPNTASKSYYSTLTSGEKVQQWVCLFYGASGTQKTRTAAQFPKPMFLSCERGKYGGLISAREFNPMQTMVKDWGDYVRLLQELEKDAGTLFQTIIIDSITAFQRLILRDVVKQSGRETPQFADWNLITERMRTAINRLSNMNAHVIFIATENIIKDEVLGRIMGGPNVAGKLAQELPAGVDINIHFTAKRKTNTDGSSTTQFKMDSKPDDIWLAKDCSGLLKSTMLTDEADKTITHFKPLFEGGTQ